MKKLLTALKTAAGIAKLVTILMFLAVAVLATLKVRGAFVDQGDKALVLRSSLAALQQKTALSDVDRASQRRLLKQARETNADLAGALKKSGVRIRSLTKVVVKQKAEIVDLQSRPATHIDDGSRVEFEHDFTTAKLTGWFEAERIVQPKAWHFELYPKPVIAMVAETDAGIVAGSPNNTDDVQTIVTHGRPTFRSRIGFFTGGEVSASGKPGLMGGVSFGKWSVYGRAGSDPAFGFFKTWSLGK